MSAVSAGFQHQTSLICFIHQRPIPLMNRIKRLSVLPVSLIFA